MLSERKIHAAPRRLFQGGHQVIRFGPAQVAEIKNMFALYSPDHDGTIKIGDLANSMADLHGLCEDDLLLMFENVGKDPRDRVDAEAYVEIFQELLQGDEGMFEILRSTGAGDKSLLADIAEKKGPKKGPSKLADAPIRFN